MAPKGEKRTYVCTCTLRCKGHKLVSKATYYGHTALRLLSTNVPPLDAPAQTTAPLTPISSEAGPSTLSARESIHSDGEHSESGMVTQRSRKRTMEEVDFGNHSHSQGSVGGGEVGGDERAQRRQRIDEDDEMPRGDDMDIVGISPCVLGQNIQCFCFFAYAVQTRRAT